MNLTDIIFATTYKESPGICEVTYRDGSTGVEGMGIGVLFEVLNKDSGRGHYLMIGRSALICVNNIVKICPSDKELILGFDTLGKAHQKLTFSEELLRKLRSNLHA